MFKINFEVAKKKARFGVLLMVKSSTFLHPNPLENVVLKVDINQPNNNLISYATFNCMRSENPEVFTFSMFTIRKLPPSVFNVQ